MNQRKERFRRHAILIADLSALIVKKLREVSDGMPKTGIVEHFSDYSIEQIDDAIESAIEDDYIEIVEHDSAPFYRAITYDEE